MDASTTIYRVPLLALVSLSLLTCGPSSAGIGPTPSLPLHRDEPAPSATAAATYYVRPDGGSADQCTGLTNAAYPGSGTGQPCAWDHPFWALQPSGEVGEPGTARIAGGDTLIIASGSYTMGLDAPGAGLCSSDYPWDCYMPPIPSGPDAEHPTRILGQGWDTGCADPPELWGRERAGMILNLTDASHVEVACLEITDHAACADGHPDASIACGRDAYPYGDWAADGLYAEDAVSVRLRHLNIHGLAEAGIRAGRLTDWTVEDVRIAANGLIGWEGDIDGDDANSGTLTFRRWTVAWNGCVETYPGGQPTGCWDENVGGYGDGVGTGETGGHWVIEDSAFLHNTSDGLDLLYTRVAGSRIEIRRTIAEGNAGNQIKTNGPTQIENSVIVGNCGYFEGQSFTHAVESCRAYGNSLALNLQPGDAVTLTNNTLTGEGDCLVEVICEGSCTGGESVRMRNNLFLGQTDLTSQSENACWVYQQGFAVDPLDADYALIHNVKENPCPVGAHDVCQSPDLVSGAVDGFDGHLQSTSPAVDAGDTAAAPSHDFAGRPRDAVPDIGAYEYFDLSPQAYLPLVSRSPAASVTTPQVAGCALFPPDNIWNRPVDGLPVHPNSAAYVNTIGADGHVHADFGAGLWEGGPIGIPYIDVSGAQTPVNVTFDYAGESDPGPYPIPPDAPIEGGPASDGDRHVLVVERNGCILYELYAAWPQPDGSWEAGSGAIFDLGSHALRPDGWTSADAAGLPILPGLVRYDEVAAGEIRHAIRFTAPQTQDGYVWPARHEASDLQGEQYPPLGQRFRLRADFDVSGFSPEVQVILEALQTYGMMLADNGSAWYISGAPDERWDNDALHALHQVHGSDFEAVDVSALMVDPDSGQASQ